MADFNLDTSSTANSAGVQNLQQQIQQQRVNQTSPDEEIEQETFTVNTIGFLTPISPISYNIHMRTIEVQIHHLHGLTTTTQAIAMDTIDTVDIEQGLFFGSVSINHEGQVRERITRISKADAVKIKNFFLRVIDYQRRNVVNMTGD